MIEKRDKRRRKITQLERNWRAGLRNKIYTQCCEGPVMAERMLKFVGTPQAMPEQAAGAPERRRDFQRSTPTTRATRRPEQAARCSQCGVPFCQVHCPLHNNIPDWLKLTAEGRLDEAYELSSATNNFPRSAAASARRTGCAKATASSSKGFELGHDRLGREVHHRHRLGAGLGQADPAAPRARRTRRHRRRRSGRPGRRRAAAPQGLPGARSTTATTGSAAC